MMWTLTLNGADITAKVDGVTVTFAAENVCGEITVELADRSAITGLILPRVPQEPIIAYRHSPTHPVMLFYLEEIQHPQDLTAKTATLWGRSMSARLTSPWAQKISKQWPGGNTVAGIIAEVAGMAGVTVNVTNDYDVCQYCYAVSDQTPAEIIRDLATRSGQVLWPEVDGTLTVAPRLYRSLPAPVVTLDAAEVVIESVDRQVPDFGNRILVSGDASVAGLSVTVVPMYPGDDCVPADGETIVRLVAVVLGMDGQPVATGTDVRWQCSGGTLAEDVTATTAATITGELQRADSFRTVRLSLPAASVVGVYDYIDYRRVRNLFEELDGSVSGNLITFGQSLKYYDQALIIDYDVAAATNEWAAGYVPGDVTIIASVAGAQGMTTIHQSNPVACASQISLEMVPVDACIGTRPAILAKVGLFGGPGRGPAVFSIDGCGSLSSSRKALGRNVIRETLRTSTWGGVSQVNLSAYPVDGTISVYQPAAPGAELYASHKGRQVNLSGVVDNGTTVAVVYTADGTAMVSWIPTGNVTGEVIVSEWLETTDDGTSSFVELTHLPTTNKSTPVLRITQDPLFSLLENLYGSHVGETVTLNERLDPGTAVYCRYWVDQPLQPDCTAKITVRVDDGSQDGGSASMVVRARDCRVQSTDPSVPVDESSELDPVTWPDQLTIPDVVTECEAGPILARTPAPNGMNWRAVSAVATAADCPGLCTCDQICTALRSSGELGKAGFFWSQCVSECEQARIRACVPCELTGPTSLAPGVVGYWDDGKGNQGEYSGDLEYILQGPSGYALRMPTGGFGPFEIKVCYDRSEESCCTATVASIECGLSGPATLAPGQEGAYAAAPGITPTSPALMMTGMYEVRRTPDAITARLQDGACQGVMTPVFEGLSCDPFHVESTLLGDVGVVTGPNTLAPGETGTFFYAFSPSGNLDELEYTGSLEIIGTVAGGAVLRMPADAQAAMVYSASWSAACGRTASKDVTSVVACGSTIPTSGPGNFTVGAVVRFPPSPTSVDDPEYHPDRSLGDPSIYTGNQCGVVTDVITTDANGFVAWYGRWATWLTQRCTAPACTHLYIVTHIAQPPVDGEGNLLNWPATTHRVVGSIYT